ncbi:hypothetical protein P2318_33100 [Myxococcaceae bacterium GXIMD 01537]
MIPFEEHQIPWKVSGEQWARFVESTLLAQYQREHLELPPFNVRGEGDVILRALVTIGDALSQFRIGIRGSVPPRAENEDMLATLGLVLREGQDLTAPIPHLFWTWPKSFWGTAQPWWAHQLQAATLYLVIPDQNPLLRRFTGLDFKPARLLDTELPWLCASLTRSSWHQELESGDFSRMYTAMDAAIGTLRAGVR